MPLGLVYEGCWPKSPCIAEYFPFLLVLDLCVLQSFLDTFRPIKDLDPFDLVVGLAGGWRTPRKAKQEWCTRSPNQTAQGFRSDDVRTVDNHPAVE